MRRWPAAARAELKAQLEREGLALAGFRVVPTTPGRLRGGGPEDPAAHRAGVRQLPQRGYRRGQPSTASCSWRAAATEKQLAGPTRGSTCPSLSASTIVYKGMVMPEHLAEFYPDLADPRLESLGGGVSPALLDQYAAAVAPGPPVPLRGAQRRDQHHRGQPPVGAWPARRCCARRCCRISPTSCRWCRSRARTRRAWTTWSRCCSWAASTCRTRCGC